MSSLYSLESILSLNGLEECNILDKVIYQTNVHKHNDAMVTIKVQEFGSYYTNTCIISVIVLHVNATVFGRTREPDRTPLKRFGRLSKKSRKLQSFVRPV